MAAYVSQPEGPYPHVQRLARDRHAYGLARVSTREAHQGTLALGCAYEGDVDKIGYSQLQ